jgi:hypothetical protein
LVGMLGGTFGMSERIAVEQNKGFSRKAIGVLFGMIGKGMVLQNNMIEWVCTEQRTQTRSAN